MGSLWKLETVERLTFLGYLRLTRKTPSSSSSAKLIEWRGLQFIVGLSDGASKKCQDCSLAGSKTKEESCHWPHNPASRACVLADAPFRVGALKWERTTWDTVQVSIGIFGKSRIVLWAEKLNFSSSKKRAAPTCRNIQGLVVHCSWQTS